MRNIALLYVLCLLMASCEKYPDNITVLLNQSGTLSVKVIDNNQNGYNGVVGIYSPVGRIYYDTTDANGMCSIGKVLQGQYEYFVVAEKDNKFYSYSESFQVIAGDDKVINVNPFLNVGDARVKIINTNSEPISGVFVAAIPHPNYSNESYYFQDLIDEAYGIGKTDSEGWVIIEDMPVDTYSVLVFYDNDYYDYTIYSNYFYVYRDNIQSFTIKVNL
jgi:hypothetical protein